MPRSAYRNSTPSRRLRVSRRTRFRLGRPCRRLRCPRRFWRLSFLRGSSCIPQIHLHRLGDTGPRSKRGMDVERFLLGSEERIDCFEVRLQSVVLRKHEKGRLKRHVLQLLYPQAHGFADVARFRKHLDNQLQEVAFLTPGALLLFGEEDFLTPFNSDSIPPPDRAFPGIRARSRRRCGTP